MIEGERPMRSAALAVVGRTGGGARREVVESMAPRRGGLMEDIGESAAGEMEEIGE